MRDEPNKAEVYSFLRYAFRTNIAGVELRTINQLVFDTARKNDKRPAKFELFVEDEWVKNIRGNQLLQDVFVMVRVPRETFDLYLNELRERASPSLDPPESGSHQSESKADAASPANLAGPSQ